MQKNKDSIVKENIISQDFIIRSSAIGYFNESFSMDEEVVECVIESIRKYKDQFERSYIIRNCENLNIGNDGWKKLLSLGIDDEIFNINVASLMITNGLDVIEEFYDEIINAFLKREELKNFDIFKYVNFLRGIRENSTNDLLKMLKKHVENEEKKINDFDLNYGMYIVNELRLRTDLDYNFIKRQINKCKSQYYKFYLIELLSELKDEKLINFLISQLDEDNYLVNESIGRALAKMNSDKVIEEINKIYSESSYDIRLYLTMVFDRIKTPFAEKVCFNILKEEKYFDIRSILASQLCRMYSKDAIEYVYNMIEKEDYDENMVNLKRELYVSTKINNVKYKEVESWRKEIDIEMENIKNSKLYLKFSLN